jgi:hypothetical protein
VSNLDTMSFLTKGDFEEFANGALVIDHENVYWVLARSLSGCFSGLHSF